MLAEAWWQCLGNMWLDRASEACFIYAGKRLFFLCCLIITLLCQSKECYRNVFWGNMGKIHYSLLAVKGERSPMACSAFWPFNWQCWSWGRESYLSVGKICDGDQLMMQKQMILIFRVPWRTHLLLPSADKGRAKVEFCFLLALLFIIIAEAPKLRKQIFIPGRYTFGLFVTATLL